MLMMIGCSKLKNNDNINIYGNNIGMSIGNVNKFKYNGNNGYGYSYESIYDSFGTINSNINSINSNNLNNINNINNRIVETGRSSSLVGTIMNKA